MFKTKAQNLKLLKKFVRNKKVDIPIFFYFTKKDFYKKKIFYLNKIKSEIFKNDIIIRSSALSEDRLNKSYAGKYESKIFFRKKIRKLKHEIELFLRQFDRSNDEIIVQKFIKKVDIAGVIFTKDSKYNSPYYLINYDTSGKTNLITSGFKNKKKKQLIIFKEHKTKSKFKDLLDECKNLEKHFKNNRLDIEFAIKGKKIYLFQIRPLPYNLPKENSKIDPIYFSGAMVNIEKKISKLIGQSLNLHGKFTAFSNMADWNPAEMIGDKPNPLALSLYKELITDEVWREQRANYGYKNVFPNVLMFSFAGSPFIDLRTDLNSFLPKKIDKEICNKIINKCLLNIKKNFWLHDKIEFKVIETCYSFGSKKRLQKNFNNQIVEKYIKELKYLTTGIIKGNFLNEEILKLDELSLNLKVIEKKKISPLQKIFFLIEVIKKYGTLPFAGLARMAFISQILLLDLKKLDLISEAEFETFFKSLKLINFEISDDHNKVVDNKISKKLFIKKYGHIRPSTYDINSLSYKEDYSKYFLNKKKILHKKNKENITFKKYKKIDKLFKDNLNVDFKSFLFFAKKTITYREKSKFLFSKGIDKIFDKLITLSKEINIPRSDLCYLDIKNIINFYSKLESTKLRKTLLDEIYKNKKDYDFLKKIKLPDVIFSKKNIYEFEERFTKINFITNKKTVGDVVEIGVEKKSRFLDNKLILITNADPGYDFIFNYKIKGLITMYGGSNSHMAIRCLEQNIPAAIGVGKLKYQEVLNSHKMSLDCLKEKLYVIN